MSKREGINWVKVSEYLLETNHKEDEDDNVEKVDTAVTVSLQDYENLGISLLCAFRMLLIGLL